MRIGPFAHRAWHELEQDLEDLEQVIESDGDVPLSSTLPVGQLAWDSVAVASLALESFPRRGGRAKVRIRLDPQRVATAFTSERHFLLDGEPVNPWAELSGFWRCSDGWVRTHANYPHHAERLRTVLGLAPGSTRDAAEQAIGQWLGVDLEEAAASQGALAFAVRTPHQWLTSAQGSTVRDPWIRNACTAAGAPPGRRGDAHARLPLDGVRVLDLTRVIAGPVAGRTLGLAGADVLRVDPPHLEEPQWQHLDTGHHKRSTVLDLRNRHDRAVFDELAADADILLLGYAPTALDHLGLHPQAVAERFPGVVAGYIQAWSPTGPWGSRRGFDSLVQAASGIAHLEGDGSGRPGALPAQALDHASGYLLAAAVVTLLARQHADGGSWSASLSLQRCAELLIATGRHPEASPSGDSTLDPTTVDLISEAGRLTVAVPPLSFRGSTIEYAHAARPWGMDLPRWGTQAPTAASAPGPRG